MMQALFENTDYTKMLFDTQSNVIIGINTLKANGSLDYDDTIYSPDEIKYKNNQAANVT